MDQKELITKDSHYASVMAIARRARQLMRESFDKGVSPWEVSLVKVGDHKPIKLALEEYEQGMIGYKFREEKPVKGITVEKSATETVVAEGTEDAAE